MLKRIKLVNFRNLNPVTIEFDPYTNLIYGENGSGKSSLLEAIYTSNYGKSFRTNKINNLITHSQEMFVAYLEHSIRGKHIPLGFQKSATMAKLKIEGKYQRSFSTFSYKNPMQVIEPGSFSLLERGPEERRKLIDWGVFHVEHSYSSIWTHFKNSIKQRNALLKHDKIDSVQFKYWTEQFCAASQALAELRVRYTQELNDHLYTMLQSTPLASTGLNIRFYKGWDDTDSLENELTKDAFNERRYKHTLHGPHKADLKITHNGRPAVETYSRGQQKLLIALIKIAQLKLLADKIETKSILLFDDIDSELDKNFLTVLLQQARQYCDQLFLTSTSRSVLEELPLIGSAKMFHVEHGSVTSILSLEKNK